MAAAECAESGPIPGRCPVTEVHVDWHDWLVVHAWWPFGVQIALSTVFLLLLHPAYVEAYYRRGSAFQHFVKTYVGTSARHNVARPQYLVALCLVQQVGSVLSVAIWVMHTYWRETRLASRIVRLCLSCTDLLGWFVCRLGAGGEILDLWRHECLVDILTMVPVLMQALVPSAMPQGYDDWLTLDFLRSYSALRFFERARRVGRLDESNAAQIQVVVQLVFRVSALLICMAGTIFTLEILGDPEWLRDNFIVTAAGDRLSFLQMVYWIFVTITTVGYGDWTPKTVLTRVFTTIFIVVGVFCMYVIQYSFTEMMRKQHEGIGRYQQTSWGRNRHVVVILCHRGSASRMSSLIHGFLQELLHANHNETEDHHDHASSVYAHLRLWVHGAPPAHQQTWPDVVFLSPTKWEEEQRSGVLEGSSFSRFLQETEDFPARVQRRIWFLVGHITSENDLRRANVHESALTYILSDQKSTSPEEDDAQSIYTAVVVRDLFPHVRLRLMVTKPESKQLAVQAGIHSVRCFSSRELLASILAQNARCHGLITAVTAMFKSADGDDEEFFLRHLVQENDAGPARRGTRLGGRSRSSSWVGSSEEEVAKVSSCRTLTDIEKILRKSEAHWCPETGDYRLSEPWMFEYFEGTMRSVFGFDLNARYAGFSYGALVMAVYRESGAVLLGVQTQGRLSLCPQGRKWKAQEGQICFAIAKSAASLDTCRWNPADATCWRARFQNMRRRYLHTKHETHAIDAAKLMGNSLVRSLLRRTSESNRPSESNKVSGLSPPPTPDIPPVLPGPSESIRQYSKEPVDDDLLGDIYRTTTELSASSPVVAPDSEVEAPTGPSFRLEEAVPSRQSSGLQQKRLSPVRHLRQGLRNGEELVVLIVCQGECWQQVRAFVSTLRQDYLPFLQPLVVLAPTAPPVGFLDDYQERVVCMQGSCLRAQTLVEAGVVEASVVVVLAGEVTRVRTTSSGWGPDLDYRMVLCGHELECWLGNSQTEIFTTFELHDSRSARYLPRIRGKQAVHHKIMTENLTRVCSIPSQRSAWESDGSNRSLQESQQRQVSGTSQCADAAAPDEDAEPAMLRRLTPRNSSRKQTQERIEEGVVAGGGEAGGGGATPSTDGDSAAAISASVAQATVEASPTRPSRTPSHVPSFNSATSGKRMSWGSFSLKDYLTLKRPASDGGAEQRKGGEHNDDWLKDIRGASKESSVPWDLESWSTVADDNDEEDDEALGTGIEDAGHSRTLREWFRDTFSAGAHLEEKSHESIVFHPRFAAGQIFTPELWGTMLGRMFYMPAVIELIEALVIPSRRGQHAYPWQVNIPPMYIGRPFSELVADLAFGVSLHSTRSRKDAPEQSYGPPSVPIALYRLREDFGNDAFEPPRGPQHRLNAQELASLGADIPHVAEGIGGHHFLLLAPPLDMPLLHGDWAIVLGGKSFGRHMHQRGLLRGSGIEPSAPTEKESFKRQTSSENFIRLVSEGSVHGNRMTPPPPQPPERATSPSEASLPSRAYL